ncbi:MAG: ArsR/SmtB family transcription factor [Caldisericaceae bacterium]
MKKDRILLCDDYKKCLQASEFLTVLGNPARVAIVCYLTTGEKTVTEISKKTKLSQGTASLHLGRLYSSGWVNRRREGRLVYYSIKNDLIVDLLTKVGDMFIKQNKKKGDVQNVRHEADVR